MSHKALTVKQPFAWAIAAGHKTVENRSRGAQSWKPLDDLFIHAGAAWSLRGAADPRIREAWWGAGWEAHAGLDAVDMAYGFRKIVAVVDLVDVHPDSGCCEPWGERTYKQADGETVTWVTHLLLDNVRPLVEPLPWARGALGLWTLPDEVAAEALERVAMWSEVP